MRYKILLSVFILFTLTAECQVTLNIQVPPIGVVQKSQLWNLSLVNSGNGPITVYLELSLLSSNTPVMRAIAKPIVLSQGIKQIRDADVTPVSYNYLSSSFALSQISNSSFLPIGTYDACYSVSYYQGETKVLLTEDCINLEVEPLSPPLLNTPGDGDTILTRYPLFTWLPPSPINLFDNINYNLKLVEVLESQTPSQAIQNNLPINSKNGIKNLYHHYPASFKPLDTGRLYAWRIIANSSTQFIAQSEIWSFRIVFSQPQYNITEGAFIKLKRGAEASYIQCKGQIRFEYDNAVGDSLVSYSIRTMDDKTIQKQGLLSVTAGLNFITLKGNSLLNKADYLLELVNSRSEVWALKFTYINTSAIQ